uniref:Uncharacterized protein n=1 Tax=Zea mays TaxID=4577 RepID=A0A804Q1P7_MAIZE
MADANPTLMLLTIFLLVTSATAGCIRINLSHSGMRCTPGDACPVICAKIKGIDGNYLPPSQASLDRLHYAICLVRRRLTHMPPCPRNTSLPSNIDLPCGNLAPCLDAPLLDSRLLLVSSTPSCDPLLPRHLCP